MVKRKKNGNRKRKRKKNKKNLYVIDISSIDLEDLDILDNINNDKIKECCEQHNILCYNINSDSNINLRNTSPIKTLENNTICIDENKETTYCTKTVIQKEIIKKSNKITEETVEEVVEQKETVEEVVEQKETVEEVTKVNDKKHNSKQINNSEKITNKTDTLTEEQDLNNVDKRIVKRGYEKNNTFLKSIKTTKQNKISSINYCSNCGKFGHNHNVCLEPLTSYGLICFKKFIVNNNYIYKTILVKRNFSIGLIELLRGKYQLNNDKYILKLINLMTISEKKTILYINDFDKLREHIKMENGWNYNNKEYNLAKEKFNTLKQRDILSKLISKSTKVWKDTEWGLPKGRRNSREGNIECAIREFIEETGITKDKITILENVKPLEEIYIGINNIKYKHIYYFSIIEDEFTNINNNNSISNITNDNIEISDVKWFTLIEIRNIIRYYYVNKYNIIRKGFQLINNLNYYFSYE